MRALYAAALAVLIGTLVGTTGVVRAENKREPIIIIGLRPGSDSINGPVNIRRLSEAQRLRRVLGDVVRDATDHPIIDDSGLRTALGLEYLVDFMDCRGAAPCVARLVRRLQKFSSTGVYGEYVVDDHKYRFRVHSVDVRKAKILADVEFELDEGDVEDRQHWRRELTPLFAATPTEATPPTPPPPGAGSGSGGGSGSDSGTGGGSAAISETSGGDGGDSGIPELAPISTNGSGDTGAGDGGATASATASSASPFIDNSVLDAISRGVAWHGHFQDYSAMGVRKGFSKDVIAFDDRLQLEFESSINHVRVVGKPQLMFNVLDGSFQFRFREMYAARDYKRVDIAVGEQIEAWGITDFWPVVDIINPRDYLTIKNWRPIDEKLPVPMIKSTFLFGRMSLHLIAMPRLGRTAFQLDQTKPFALPLPVPPGATIEAKPVKPDLSNVGGGVRADIAMKAWKLSFYGLAGRDPFPTVAVHTDPMTMQTKLVVDNERVAMAAASLVGSIDALGAILKTEGAAYLRLENDCEGMTGELVPGLPQCFFLRRVPTGRANIGLERRILPGLEAHLQFISEITRSADIPRLPGVAHVVAPGLPEQYPWNKIFTLRLQGSYARGDFVPTAFIYWSVEDEAFFVNTDLEYHLADGFALALGGFLFQGYASDPKKDRYTLAGSLAGSSNVYLRATAWF